jgi:HD-GYP domain-containing protein (c-di-GMP phosphodiesterase class II)
MVAAVIIMALTTVGIVIVIGSNAARQNAASLFTRVGSAVGDQLEAVLAVPLAHLEYAASEPDAQAPFEGSGVFHPFFPFLEGALRSSPALRSLTLTDGKGLIQVIQASDPEVAAHYQAPLGTRFIVRLVSGSGQTLSFLRGGHEIISQRWDPATFSVTGEEWYRLAKAARGIGSSDGTAIESPDKPTFTVARAYRGGRVLAVELGWEKLQSWLARQVSWSQGRVRLESRGGVVAQSPGFELHSNWIGQVQTRKTAGQSFRILVTAPAEVFNRDFVNLELAVTSATGILLLALVPLTVIFTRRLTSMIERLSLDVDRVWQMDFSGEAPQSSRIREFDQLARGFAQMKTKLQSETQVLADAQLKLKKIVETGIALSTEKDSNALCQKILDTAKELTDADGGTLYLLSSKERQLDFNIMLNDTLGTRFGGTSPTPIPPGLKVKLYKDDGGENHNNVASHAFLTGETINIADAYDDDRFDFSGTRKFDESNGYRSMSFLTVPLKPMGGSVLGALQLINAKGPTGGTVPFTSDMQDFVEALAASAATAIYNKQLLDDLEQLFDAIIDIINGAIGRKSPYTGGHCERVPIIATALAKVTSDVKSGPLAGFHLDAKELREFVLAAKLHDVGKVTTPEYVVDKSTKLETIYNRIHEIRTRFEVLYRDAVITRHEAVLTKKKTAAVADKELAAFKATLEEEWAFIATTNLGGEFLAPDKVEKVKAIGARTWLRYFDDRLGLSWEEERRLEGIAPAPLPAEEHLLADKPVQIIARQVAFADAYKTPEGSPYPFKTPVPELLYNQGELYNLAIGRGTLTNEEHFKIKEHVMQSIYMLDRLPWPKGLEHVPTIAGEHHETLIGTGYPFQREAQDLSMQSRILTVADIFEALTASDRPYKKPKMLSEAVKVLYFFKKDKHIDSDLFDLFLTSGVFLEYAKQYLRPDQIDEVDIQPYLGPVA